MYYQLAGTVTGRPVNVGLYRYHTIAWYILVHTGIYWYEFGTNTVVLRLPGDPVCAAGPHCDRPGAVVGIPDAWTM